MSLWQSLIVATILAVGGSVAWAIVVLWCLMIGAQATSGSLVHEYLQVTQEGKPLILRYYGYNYGQTRYLDLEGNTVVRDAREPYLAGATFTARPRGGFGPRLNMGSVRIAAFNDGGQPAVYWYVMQDGSDDVVFFVGYDSLTKLRVGYLGAGGFQSERPARSEMFPIDVQSLGPQGVFGAISSPFVSTDEPQYAYGYAGPHRIASWMVYLVSGRRLIEVDLQKRSVRPILEADGILAVGIVDQSNSAARADIQNAIPSSRQNLLVRKADALLVVAPEEGRQKSFPLPTELQDAALTVYQTGEDELLAIAARALGQGSYENRLYWLDDSGKVARRRDTKLQSGATNPLPDQALVAASLPSPLALTLVAMVVVPLGHLESGEESSYGAALNRSLSDWWLALLPLYAVGAALAWATYRRHRQFALPWGLVWALIVFALGPLGFVAYLYHRAWPACQPCPHCSQVSPRDRESCTECQAPFPLPPRKGIEVFA